MNGKVREAKMDEIDPTFRREVLEPLGMIAAGSHGRDVHVHIDASKSDQMTFSLNGGGAEITLIIKTKDRRPDGAN